MNAVEGLDAIDGQPSPAAESVSPRERWIAAGLLLVAVAFNLYHLFPEAVCRAPLLNDGVLHLQAVRAAADALAAGGDPTDVWLADIGLGYPLFHHYQHLSYLPPAFLHWLSHGALSLEGLLHWSQYLLLSLFPLSVYWAMRRLGFGRVTAGLAGLAAPLAAGNGLYGLEYSSYVWGGFGLYTQLWGMVLLPPAIAEGYRAIRTGRGFALAAALLAATTLCHLVFGYIAALSVALCVVVQPSPPAPSPTQWERGLGVRALRLALLLLLVAAATAYFAVPFVADRDYMNRSVWESAEKYDSYGHARVLSMLAAGELFDFGRLPTLTLLVAGGFLVALLGWRRERNRLPVALFVVWLALFFGRPTWGPLIDLLPMGRSLHLHRLVAGVHLGGLLLAGIALAPPWRWAVARRNAAWLLAPAALTALLLYPAYAERAEYLGRNGAWIADSERAESAERDDLARVFAAIEAAPPGRVYAGLGSNWGRSYTVGAVPMYALVAGAGLDSLGYLYHALSLDAEVQLLFDESRREQYDLFNVRYVVAPAGRRFPAFVRPVGAFGRHRLYEVASGGYFALVRAQPALAGEAADFHAAAASWLAGPLPALGQHPVVSFRAAQSGEIALSDTGEIQPWATAPVWMQPGVVISESVGRGVYSASVAVANEAAVMLKATFHPGWRANVDGAEAQTMMVMPSYVAVKVPAGVHDVRFEYRSGQGRLVLLAVGLIVLALAGLAGRRRAGLTPCPSPTGVGEG